MVLSPTGTQFTIPSVGFSISSSTTTTLTYSFSYTEENTKYKEPKSEKERIDKLSHKTKLANISIRKMENTIGSGVLFNYKSEASKRFYISHLNH